ncbi:MAG: thermonuclease family protein [Paracoccaceae bacterium]|nr:thermonuclease family protein [Paracoccaceae bacterium]
MLRIVSVLLCLMSALPAVAGPEGVIRVIDGDTIDVGGTKVRLHGIDAPELDQFCGGEGSPTWACGDWVRGEVRARYGGAWALCDIMDWDRYGRVVAKCFVDGIDLGQVLVSDGLAFAFRKYSMDYDLAEKGAAVNDRGLHATGVQSPAAFRASLRRGRLSVTQEPPSAGCAIKGNISRDGKRIYHLPGQTWYADTRISEAKGERWFCSEAEARQAGWRKARR